MTREARDRTEPGLSGVSIMSFAFFGVWYDSTDKLFVRTDISVTSTAITAIIGYCHNNEIYFKQPH